jgi:glyoxylase-like metal-dependent hydrolase (beta-lactamase superfamily II)
MDGYGLPCEARTVFAQTLAQDFHVECRRDAEDFVDGHSFDLGERTLTVVHLPGHTAGHCGLLVEPDGFFFVADIDLTSFGPFYGDLGSSLVDFEASIARCGSIKARWYATFHQKGVITGASDFRSRLHDYGNVILAREQRLLALLREPKTIGQIAEHRIVYRQQVDEPYVLPVERRTAEQHVARLLTAGAVLEVEPGQFRAARA